ncbi:universal stress protein [Sphingomonas sp. H39-1-10]|uniref:universal stress protein n=1 Tax=Sphingomonas pollutisoli TaxID=3030829 RepID=UPI0023B8BA25|nr:universal stress protein [Sphingomonas pollutisoli]MDF0487550.1 universal stress protein [Sphingomonas pollutisoli]
MKNILLLIHSDRGQDGRLQVALDLCRTIDGHVTCLDIGGGPATDTDGYRDGGERGGLLTAETSARSAVEARLAGEDISWDWIDARRDIATSLRGAAALADVIVVQRELGDFAYPEMHGAGADLIVRSGKPVLAVPAECRGLDRDAVLLAWDGSRCAACALRAAVPLLRRTRRVTIVEVQDGSITTTPAEDAAEYLSRYGIWAEIRRVDAPRAGPALLAEASSGAFGYAVMGGYGHLRLVEAAFGNATREMLGQSPIPVFLAH